MNWQWKAHYVAAPCLGVTREKVRMAFNSLMESGKVHSVSARRTQTHVRILSNIASSALPQALSHVLHTVPEAMHSVWKAQVLRMAKVEPLKEDSESDDDDQEDPLGSHDSDDGSTEGRDDHDYDPCYVEYWCQGSGRESCTVRLVLSLDRETSSWDISFRGLDGQADGGHIHARDESNVPLHPTLVGVIANTLFGSKPGEGGKEARSEADRASPTIADLAHMQPMSMTKQVEQFHKLGARDQHGRDETWLLCYLGSLDRSVSLSRAPTEYRHHLAEPVHRNPMKHRPRSWARAGAKRIPESMSGRIHDSQNTIELVKPVFRWMRLPLLASRCRFNTCDADVRSAQVVVSRVRQGQKAFMRDLQEATLDGAEGEIHVENHKYPTHAFFMTAEQQEYLGRHPRLGERVEMDTAYHIFGTLKHFVLGAIVALDPKPGRRRIVPIAFFLYDGSGNHFARHSEKINRICARWALHKLQEKMPPDTTIVGETGESRRIRKVVVDYAHPHLSAVMDIRLQQLQDEVDVMLSDARRHCDTMIEEAPSHRTIGLARQWLEENEPLTLGVLLHRAEADVPPEAPQAFAQRVVGEAPSRLPDPPEHLAEALLYLAVEEAEEWSTAYTNALQSEEYVSWPTQCELHRRHERLVARHQCMRTQSGAIKLHGCAIHALRAMGNREIGNRATHEDVVRLAQDALHADTLHDLANALGNLFHRLHVEGTPQTREYLAYFKQTWIQDFGSFAFNPGGARESTNAAEATFAFFRDAGCRSNVRSHPQYGMAVMGLKSRATQQYHVPYNIITWTMRTDKRVRFAKGERTAIMALSQEIRKALAGDRSANVRIASTSRGRFELSVDPRDHMMVTGLVPAKRKRLGLLRKPASGRGGRNWMARRTTANMKRIRIGHATKKKKQQKRQKREAPRGSASQSSVHVDGLEPAGGVGALGPEEDDAAESLIELSQGTVDSPRGADEETGGSVPPSPPSVAQSEGHWLVHHMDLYLSTCTCYSYGRSAKCIHLFSMDRLHDELILHQCADRDRDCNTGGTRESDGNDSCESHSCASQQHSPAVLQQRPREARYYHARQIFMQELLALDRSVLEEIDGDRLPISIAKQGIRFLHRWWGPELDVGRLPFLLDHSLHPDPSNVEAAHTDGTGTGDCSLGMGLTDESVLMLRVDVMQQTLAFGASMSDAHQRTQHIQGHVHPLPFLERGTEVPPEAVPAVIVAMAGLLMRKVASGELLESKAARLPYDAHQLSTEVKRWLKRTIVDSAGPDCSRFPSWLTAGSRKRKEKEVSLDTVLGFLDEYARNHSEPSIAGRRPSTVPQQDDDSDGHATHTRGTVDAVSAVEQPTSAIDTTACAREAVPSQHEVERLRDPRGLLFDNTIDYALERFQRMMPSSNVTLLAATALNRALDGDHGGVVEARRRESGRFIMAPVSVNGHHSISLLDRNARIVYHYDSIANSTRTADVSASIARFANMAEVRTVQAHVPQQANTYSCGPFTIFFGCELLHRLHRGEDENLSTLTPALPTDAIDQQVRFWVQRLIASDPTTQSIPRWMEGHLVMEPEIPVEPAAVDRIVHAYETSNAIPERLIGKPDPHIEGAVNLMEEEEDEEEEDEEEEDQHPGRFEQVTVVPPNHPAMQPSEQPRARFRNRGSDCFLIAVVQLLRHNPALQHAVMHADRSDFSAAQQRELRRVLGLSRPIHTRRRSDSREPLLRVVDLRKCLPARFRVGVGEFHDQQDAGEVLSYLLQGARELEVLLKDSNQCSGGHTADHTDIAVMLRFFAHENTFAGCIDTTMVQQIRHDWCNVCQERTKQQTTMTIETVPDLVIMEVQRVVEDQSRARIHSRIAIPKKYDGRYLVGAILQRSSGANLGHYVALVLTAGNWWLFDDSERPRALPPEEAQQQIEEDGTIFVFQAGNSHSPAAAAAGTEDAVSASGGATTIDHDATQSSRGLNAARPPKRQQRKTVAAADAPSSKRQRRR